jgi:hypothetical protein
MSRNRHTVSWRGILIKVLVASLGSFIFFTGLLFLAFKNVVPSLLSGICIAIIWGLATILIYLVWPEGLGYDR